jgi:MFS family permease
LSRRKRRAAPTLDRRLSDADNFSAALTPDVRRVIALGERLGLPRIGTARPLALAMMIDAFGSGLFLPFSLLYFHYAGGLSLTEAGLGLTISMLIAVPTPLAAGALVDRVGPKTVAVTTNAARVAGFLGYLLVHDLTALIAVALLVSVSDRLFWVAQPTLIGEFATSGSRDRWFGLTVALRAAGLGIGGLMAGLAVSRLGVTGYHALAIANAISFAFAAMLVASLRVPGRAAVAVPSPETSPKGFRAVLADRPFCWIVGSNVVFGIARTMILVGFPVYAVQVLGATAWLAGVLYAVYTALLAVAQTSLVRRLERHRRTRALMLSALLWAGSFLLLAVAPLLSRVVIVAYLSAVTVLYTVAVMLHAGVIDALVIEAAPDTLRGRYVAAFNLSWAAANALASGLFTFLLAWYAGLPWITLAVLLVLALVGVRRAEPGLVSEAVRIRPSHANGTLP